MQPVLGLAGSQRASDPCIWRIIIGIVHHAWADFASNEDRGRSKAVRINRRVRLGQWQQVRLASAKQISAPLEAISWELVTKQI